MRSTLFTRYEMEEATSPFVFNTVSERTILRFLKPLSSDGRSLF